MFVLLLSGLKKKTKKYRTKKPKTKTKYWMNVNTILPRARAEPIKTKFYRICRIAMNHNLNNIKMNVDDSHCLGIYHHYQQAANSSNTTSKVKKNKKNNNNRKPNWNKRKRKQRKMKTRHKWNTKKRQEKKNNFGWFSF